MTFLFRQQRPSGRRLMRWVPVLVAAVWLSGCMVVDTGREVKVDEAVQNRVAAGMEYLQMGQPVEARQHFSRAITLNDRSAPAHNAMALLYKYEGDREREEFHYRKALRADRDYAPARNNYGILLYQRGDFRGAVREFDRVANDSSYNSRGPAFENLGRSYLALGQRERAADAFNRALRLLPDPRSSLLELVSIHLDDGNLRLANRYYEQYAAATNPQAAMGLWLGIRLAAANGDHDRQASYELALRQMYPNSAEFRAWRDWRAGTASGSAG